MKTNRNLIAVFALILFAAVSAAAQIAPVKPAPPPPAPKMENKTAAALPKADDLIDKFVAATGGEAAYKKLNSFSTKGTFDLAAMGVKGTFEGFYKAPNKSAVFMKFPGIGDFAEIFDGAKGWSSNPIQGVREKSGDELKQSAQDSDFYRFVKLKELFPKRETKGLEKVDGADAYAVVMTATGGDAQTYYFDAKTNFLVRVDQIAVTPEGKTPAQTYLSDYRKVEGVLMPFAMRLNTSSAVITFQTEEIKANVPIDDAKFAKPAK